MTFTVQYLHEHISAILLQVLFVCIFAFTFFLYHLPLAAVLYPALVCSIVGCLFAGDSFYKAYQKHKKLQCFLSMDMESVQGSTMEDVFTEIDRVAGNSGTVESDYRQMIRKLCQAMQSAEDKMAEANREMMDYFTVWVHQIKTPIASMRLQLSGEDSTLSRKLSSELLHIERYVGMVLTYLKMGSDSTDYVFRTVDLDQLVRENIRRLRGDFIMKKLNLIYEPTVETVISDEKWLSFVVEQILSNSLKYTNEGSVRITVEEPKTLCISDTGIGISPEDLPRIFDRGYTGCNGRGDKRASGLGLFLCKQICDRLGHEIVITSQVDEGTTVRINLT